MANNPKPKTAAQARAEYLASHHARTDDTNALTTTKANTGTPARPFKRTTPPAFPPHGVAVDPPKRAPQTLNVRALQLQLVKDGYHLTVDGKLGPETISALRDYYKPTAQLSPALQAAVGRGQNKMGVRNPAAWNAELTGGSVKANLHSNPNRGGDAGATTGSIPYRGAPDSPVINLSPSARAAQAAKVDPINEALAKFGVLIPGSAADAMAGEQFDPQIREAQLSLAKDPFQGKMNEADVGAWYKQALDALGTAGTRDAAAEKAGTDSISGAGQALLASLGGGANLGAGDVGAASQNATGTLAAEGAAQDQYNADMAPILRAESAGQLQNQTNKDQAQQQADQIALENLQGSRGQAKTAAQMQIDQANNALEAQREQALMGIKSANSAAVQQGFSNSLALAQAQIAAMMSGLQVQNAEASAAKASNPGSYAYATPSQRSTAAANAVSALKAAGYIDPNSGKLAKGVTPQQAAAVAARAGQLVFPGGVPKGWGAGVINPFLQGIG